MGAVPIGEEDRNYTLFLKVLGNSLDEDSLKKFTIPQRLMWTMTMSLFINISCRPKRFFDNDGGIIMLELMIEWVKFEFCSLI